MPGIKGMLASWNEGNRKDKLSDFVERFWHYEKITCLYEAEFIEQYKLWAKERKYHQSQDKAKAIYALAHESIPTLSSETPSVKMLVTEAVRVLKEVDATLTKIPPFPALSSFSLSSTHPPGINPFFDFASNVLRYADSRTLFCQ
jgi:hypothetical protein